MNISQAALDAWRSQTTTSSLWLPPVIRCVLPSLKRSPQQNQWHRKAIVGRKKFVQPHWVQEFRTVKAQDKWANGSENDNRSDPTRGMTLNDSPAAAASIDKTAVAQAVSPSTIEVRQDKQTTVSAIMTAVTAPQVPQSLRRPGNSSGVRLRDTSRLPPLIRSFNKQVFRLLA